MESNRSPQRHGSLEALEEACGNLPAATVEATQQAMAGLGDALSLPVDLPTYQPQDDQGGEPNHDNETN